MRKWVFMGMVVCLCVSSFGQDARSAVIGTWQNDREQQRIVFNADGTVIMSAYGAALEKAMREEQNAGGGGDEEAWTGGLRGTYTVNGNSVELAFQEDRKTHKMRLRIVNANTLRMFTLNYTRVQDTGQ